MAPYLFGVRNGIHIIDLEQTEPMLHQGLQAIRDVVAGGGRVLLVGTKRQAQEPVAEAAKRCGQYYVNYRWLGGMLTNFKTISAVDPPAARARRTDHPGADRVDQARTLGADARPRQARTRAWRHQGDGRPARYFVRDRHQQGGDRGARSQHACASRSSRSSIRTPRPTASPIRSPGTTTRCGRSIFIAISSRARFSTGCRPSSRLPASISAPAPISPSGAVPAEASGGISEAEATGEASRGGADEADRRPNRAAVRGEIWKRQR